MGTMLLNVARAKLITIKGDFKLTCRLANILILAKCAAIKIS